MLKRLVLPLTFFFVGFSLITIAPYNFGYFGDWRMPLIGSYGLYLFDILAVLIIIAWLTLALKRKSFSEFLTNPHEKQIFILIFLVLVSRVASLLLAQTIEIEQFLSLLRYAGILFLTFVFADLFTSSSNRRFFMYGVLGGVLLETVAGIFIYFFDNAKGVFFSNSSFILQTFFILVVGILFASGKKKWLMAIAGIALMTAIFASLTRTGLLFLPLAILVLFLVIPKRQQLVLISLFLFFVIATSAVITVQVPQFLATNSISVNFGTAEPGVGRFDLTRGLSQNPIIARIEQAAHFGGSIWFRLYLWDKALAAFEEYPVTGIGSGGFPRQLDSLPGVFGLKAEISPEYDDYQFSAHNELLQVLAETGMVGFVIYILWLIAIFTTCKVIISLADMKKDIYLIAAIVTVLAITLSGLYGGGAFAVAPILTTYLGFILGWYREKENSGKVSSNSPTANNLTLR